MKFHLKLAALALAVVLPAAAQQFPIRPIKLISPAGAGSPTDLYARMVAKNLEGMGQPVVVENLAGAAGVIGTRALVRSQPDGYTLGLGANAYVSKHITSREVPYIWPDDFVLAHQGVQIETMLVVNNKVPVKTVQEFIAYAKANPGKLNAANPGAFTQGHIGSELLQKTAGIKFTEVRYKESPQMVNAVRTGESDLMFISPASGRPVLDGGTGKALAILSERRSSLAPEIPTLREIGFDVVYGSWIGYLLPKGTPDTIADRYFREISKALETPEMKKFLAAQQLTPLPGNRKEMELAIARGMSDLENLMRAANIEKD